MNDHQLQSFLVTARSKSFTQAARELYITPTALIQQIKLLEEGVGVALFFRTAQGVRLTEAGQSFVETAETILRVYSEGVEKAAAIARTQKGTVRIALAVEDTPPFLAELCDQFRAKYPQIRIQFVRAKFEHQLTNCAKGECEVLFFNEVDTIRELGLEFSPLYEDEMYLVMGRHHRLAGRESVALAELEGEKLYLEDMYERCPGSILEAIRAQGLDITIDNRPYDSAVVMSLSLEGGVMTTPHRWLENCVPPLRAARLEGFARRYGLVHRKKPSRAVQAFVAAAQDYFREKDGESCH